MRDAGREARAAWGVVGRVMEEQAKLMVKRRGVRARGETGGGSLSFEPLTAGEALELAAAGEARTLSFSCSCMYSPHEPHAARLARPSGVNAMHAALSRFFSSTCMWECGV